MRLPLAAAVLGLALAEAAVAANAARRSDLSFGECAVAALGAGAVVMVCAGAAAWSLSALLETRGAKALASALHGAVAAGGSVAFAWLWSFAWLGLFAAAFAWLAPDVAAEMSPRFGLAFGALVSVLGSAWVMLIAAATGHPLGRRIVPRGERARSVDRALAALGPGAGLAAAAGLVIEPSYAAAPLLGTVLCAGALASRRREIALRWSAAAVMCASLALIASLERLPSAAAEVIAYRTPVAALALGYGQRLLDRDGDGAGARLLGGDCDDADPGVHPQARDIPNNHVDENCSGRDAPRYEPRRPAHSQTVPQTPHDLIVLMIDALRPDRLSLAGYRRKTSPHIDALAREGTWFRNAYTTAPSTRFAMASLFTGRDVRRLRYRSLAGNDFRLSGGAPTLSKRLKAARYRSVGFTVRPYKFLRDHRTGALALYDVKKDRKERRSLLRKQPALAGRLADLLEGYESWAKPKR
jgi:hypothetical protein